MGQDYSSYSTALKILNLQELQGRWEIITYKFALKSSTHPKHQNWFKKYESTGPNTRSANPKWELVKANKSKLKKGPISYMTNLLNSKSDIYETT